MTQKSGGIATRKICIDSADQIMPNQRNWNAFLNNSDTEKKDKKKKLLCNAGQTSMEKHNKIAKNLQNEQIFLHH